jgi:carbon-monoxide dehydrogenase medium subunit
MTRPEVHSAQTVEEALELRRHAGGHAPWLAGGTWLLRAPQRAEPLADSYVSVARVAELRELADGGENVELGALATHARLAAAGALSGPLRALAQAAGTSGFPGIRSVATLGGNIGARQFSEADLVPALLALGARVELAGDGGRRTVALSDALTEEPDELIVKVLLSRPPGQVSGYRRLTVRGGGEYAVASVAICATLDPDGTVTAARVAVGAVEQAPRVSQEAADALLGRRLDARSGQAAGQALADACVPRANPDAPGWYRQAVLPVLAERVAADIATQEAGA